MAEETGAGEKEAGSQAEALTETKEAGPGEDAAILQACGTAPATCNYKAHNTRNGKLLVKFHRVVLQ